MAPIRPSRRLLNGQQVRATTLVKTKAPRLPVCRSQEGTMPVVTWLDPVHRATMIRTQ